MKMAFYPRLSVWAPLVVALVAGVGTAKADLAGTTWSVTFQVGDDNIAADITLGPSVGGGYYDIKTLTGIANGGVMTLDSTPISHLPNGPYSTDNVFDPLGDLAGTPPYVDQGGLAYFEGSDPQGYAFFWDAATSQYEGCWASSCGTTLLPVKNLQITPEPSPVIFMSTVLLGVAIVARKRIARG